MPHLERRDLEPFVQDIIDDPMTRQLMDKWGVQTDDLMALLEEAKKSCERVRLAALGADPETVIIN